MKTLHLLRHAKSSWAEHGVDDHDRDLNNRGRRDAPRMGSALRAFCPLQPMYGSSAVRAQRTVEGVVEGWPEMAGQAHRVVGELYTFDHRDLLSWLSEFEDTAERCFVVAHNPGLTALCNQLCGRLALDNLPTAGYLELVLDLSRWADIAPGCGDIERWLFPKELDRL